MASRSNDLTFAIIVNSDKAVAGLNNTDEALKDLNKNLEKTKNATPKETDYNKVFKNIGEVGDKIDRVGGSALRMASQSGVLSGAMKGAGETLTGIGDVADRVLSQGFNPLSLGITAVALAVPALISAFQGMKFSMEDINGVLQSTEDNIKKVSEAQTMFAQNPALANAMNINQKALSDYQKQLKDLERQMSGEFTKAFDIGSVGDTTKKVLKDIEKQITFTKISMEQMQSMFIIGGEKQFNNNVDNLSESMNKINGAFFTNDKAIQQLIKSYKDQGVEVSADTILFKIFGDTTMENLIRSADANEKLKLSLDGLRAKITGAIEGYKETEKASNQSRITQINNAINLSNQLLQNRIQYYEQLKTAQDKQNQDEVSAQQYRKDLITKANQDLAALGIRARLTETNQIINDTKITEEQRAQVLITQRDITNKLLQEQTAQTQASIMGAMAFDPMMPLNTSLANTNEKLKEMQTLGQMATESLMSMGISAEQAGGLVNLGESALNGMSNALAQSIATAAFGEGSFSESMKKMAKAALQGVAVQAAVKAIFFGAEALAYLVTGNPVAAAMAGKSSAMYAAAAVAAGAASTLISKPSQSSSGSMGSGATGGAGQQGGGSTVATTINIYGDVEKSNLEKMKKQQENLESQLQVAS